MLSDREVALLAENWRLRNEIETLVKESINRQECLRTLADEVLSLRLLFHKMQNKA